MALATSLRDAGFDFQAAATLTKTRQKAKDDFTWDNGQAICAKISIKTVCQWHRRWESAEPWFEFALADSSKAWGKEDSLTRSLQRAMETRQLSERHLSGLNFLHFG